MSGTTQELTFISNPEGATVQIDGRRIGETPLTTTLKRDSGQTLEFIREGYKPLKLQLETRINGWFWGNIVYGGFFGSTTDGINGAVHEYAPSQYVVSLQPVGSGRMDGGTSKSPRQKTRDFILIAYRDIIANLRDGKGPHLAALLDQLGIPPEERDLTVGQIRQLSETHADISSFAEHVLKLGTDPSVVDLKQDAPEQISDRRQIIKRLGKLRSGQTVRLKLVSERKIEGEVISFEESGGILWIGRPSSKKMIYAREIEWIEIDEKSTGDKSEP